MRKYLIFEPKSRGQILETDALFIKQHFRLGHFKIWNVIEVLNIKRKLFVSRASSDEQFEFEFR